MKIFLTGATGYIGAAVADRLNREGHEIVALTRDEKKAGKLRERGLTPVVGNLREPTWRREADDCDALIHLGYEFGEQAAQVDRRGVETLLASARCARAPRLVVYTSGVWVLGPHRGAPAEEDARPDPPEIVRWRPAVEEAVLSCGREGLSAVVIRPGCVYGGSGGLYGMMIQAVLAEREVRLAGDGSNRWAAVYLDDLAELYRLVVERRPHRALYHATDGVAEPVREVAEAFAAAAGGAEVLDWPIAEARRALGPLADALAMDQRVSSERAWRELGWRPQLCSAAMNAEALLAQWGAKVSAPSVA
jgi:nucleoside-diphosphate-sugar epimerase